MNIRCNGAAFLWGKPRICMPVMDLLSPTAGWILVAGFSFSGNTDSSALLRVETLILNLKPSTVIQKECTMVLWRPDD